LKLFIDFILSLGVSDVKLSVSSHQSHLMPDFIKDYSKYPILNYRVENFKNKKNMRGFPANKCYIASNDVTIVGKHHYPCLVYFREGGKPIGMVSKNIYAERNMWVLGHESKKDPICKKFCMDFKCEFNHARESILL
jgi:hypothetical protein